MKKLCRTFKLKLLHFTASTNKQKVMNSNGSNVLENF